MHPGREEKDHRTNNPVYFKSMNYIGLTPILVEAIKEQQQIIEDLRTKEKQDSDDIQLLKREIENLKKGNIRDAN